MDDEIHWFMTVNGHTYGVRANKTRSFVQDNVPKVWRIQIAEYGVDDSISICSLPFKYDSDDDTEYQDLEHAAGAAFKRIIEYQLGQAEEISHAKDRGTDNHLVRDPFLLPKHSRSDNESQTDVAVASSGEVPAGESR